MFSKDVAFMIVMASSDSPSLLTRDFPYFLRQYRFTRYETMPNMSSQQGKLE
jgi:hypothetical protein